MSSNVRAGSDFDRLVTAWLADGPAELSDRVMAEALRDVHLTAQRRRWAPWRSLAMTFHPTHAFERFATVVIVGALAIGGALYAVNLPPATGPSTSPTPSSTAPAERPRAALPAGWVHVTYSGQIVDEWRNGVRAQVTARLDFAPATNQKTVGTDADGRWTMTFLGRPNTDYCLDATVTMPAGTWHRNLTPLGCVRRMPFYTYELPQSSIVSGSVVDEAGNPVTLGPGDSIRVQTEGDGVSATANVRNDGSFSISVPRGTTTHLSFWGTADRIFGGWAAEAELNTMHGVNGLVVTMVGGLRH